MALFLLINQRERQEWKSNQPFLVNENDGSNSSELKFKQDFPAIDFQDLSVECSTMQAMDQKENTKKIIQIFQKIGILQMYIYVHLYNVYNICNGLVHLFSKLLGHADPLPSFMWNFTLIAFISDCTFS